MQKWKWYNETKRTQVGLDFGIKATAVKADERHWHVFLAALAAKSVLFDDEIDSINQI